MELRDAKNIIQPSNIVFENDLVDTSQYSWNVQSPSEITEAMLATIANQE